ncbi:unnamed protein product, partial [Prorocentrum cordatum]
DTILFYLVAKAAGGFCNLGLMPELARPWEAIRMPRARYWEGANRKPCDWAARGRSSERAAWEQALFCESTVAEGIEYAVTYFDLVKCFEYVTHKEVWQAGTRSGFNAVILKMVLRIYSIARRIVLDNACAEGKGRARSVVAGSRLAYLCLEMVTFGELDGEVAQRLIDMFEGLDMKVPEGAEGKTATVASATALQDGLAKRVRPMGVRMARHAGHLGVATAIIRLGRVPSAMYVVQVMGMASSTLVRLRQSVATSFRGNTMGKSTPLVLLAEDPDPGIRANVKPLVNWTMA